MARIGIVLPGPLSELIDRQAAQDGHSNRCAVLRKALNAFFAGTTGGGNVVTAEPTTKTGSSRICVSQSPAALCAAGSGFFFDTCLFNACFEPLFDS